MKIEIKFCVVWNYTPQAARLAEELISKYRQRITQITLIPSEGGCFEVTLAGKLIFSKLERGRFPDHQEIFRSIGD